jgi:aspartyl/asparaginyl-tRNA synthetase
MRHAEILSDIIIYHRPPWLDLQLIKLPEIATKDVGETVRFRARVHHIRPVGPKIAFIVFRHQLYTIQGVLTEENDEVSENMVRWAEGLGRETVVLVQGVVQPPPESQGEVKSTTIHERELKVTRVRLFTQIAYSIYLPCSSFTSSHILPYLFRSRSRTSANLLNSTSRCAANAGRSL